MKQSNVLVFITVERRNMNHSVKYEPPMTFHFGAPLKLVREMSDTNNRYR